MEEQEYFTPEIEDIKIGYECEADISFYTNAHKPTWNKNVFKGLGQDIINYHSWGMYRTPYLTKEQIENEGWKEICVYNYKKDNKISCFYYNNILVIYRNVKCIFDGKCKDINTFRYICKLLEI